MKNVIKAHYDGHVVILDEPADLPVGCLVEVQVKSAEEEATPWSKLLKLVDSFPVVEDAPTDGAQNYEHYLYGSPKQS